MPSPKPCLPGVARTQLPNWSGKTYTTRNGGDPRRGSATARLLAGRSRRKPRAGSRDTMAGIRPNKGRQGMQWNEAQGECAKFPREATRRHIVTQALSHDAAL